MSLLHDHCWPSRSPEPPPDDDQPDALEVECEALRDENAALNRLLDDARAECDAAAESVAHATECKAALRALLDALEVDNRAVGSCVRVAIERGERVAGMGRKATSDPCEGWR